jgi:hypothetical protein
MAAKSGAKNQFSDGNNCNRQIENHCATTTDFSSTTSFEISAGSKRISAFSHVFAPSALQMTLKCRRQNFNSATSNPSNSCCFGEQTVVTLKIVTEGFVGIWRRSASPPYPPCVLFLNWFEV